MKIAISATGPNLEDMVDPRLGRCQYLIIVNPEKVLDKDEVVCLLEKGVDANQLDIQTYGEGKPIAPNKKNGKARDNKCESISLSQEYY